MKRRPRSAGFPCCFPLLIMLMASPFLRGWGPQIIIDEGFADLTAWDDLSTAISWSGQPPDGSAWTTDGDMLHLNAAGIASVGLTPWDSINKTRSFTAIDRQFSDRIVHRETHLVVEFRVRWESLIPDLRGEWNRINMMLVHDYPEGGLDLTRDGKVFDFTDAWWGRPNYQVRIRGNANQDGTALLMYGGGYDPEGEFEIYHDTSGNPLWWLPGFSSTAGGENSEGGPSPGVGSPWPYNGWSRSSRGLASLDWQRFRYVVSPNGSALYIDANDDGAGWVRDGFLPHPEEADAPASAPLYRYFEHIEGLRIYFRGYENAFMDYVRVWSWPEAVTGSVSLDEAGGRMHLTFHAAVGEHYQMQTSTTLQQWDTLPTVWEGDGFYHSVDVTDLMTEGASFFRMISSDAPDAQVLFPAWAFPDQAMRH